MVRAIQPTLDLATYAIHESPWTPPTNVDGATMASWMVVGMMILIWLDFCGRVKFGTFHISLLQDTGHPKAIR